MLKKHKYYVYHDGKKVFARIEGQKPVLMETCETPQDAFDKVQAIINPTKRAADSFKELDSHGRVKGFNSAEFQDAISGNCEAAVKAAYKKAGK